MKVISIILAFNLYCFDVFTMTINQSMSQAYNSSPEILALRSKLKAYNQDIAKILSNKRPNVNLDARMGYDKTDTISTSSVEKTQYNKLISKAD